MSVNLFLPQVTRIPIAGPAPYNTLVCVQAVSGGGPGVIEYGKLNHLSVQVPTGFKLAGFDQRVAPAFAHSTTAYLSSIGPYKDSLWVIAVDAVRDAGFSPYDGTYFLTIDVGVMPAEPLPGSCLSLGPGGTWCWSWMIIQVTSFVLCYEPPVPSRSPVGRSSSSGLGVGLLGGHGLVAGHEVGGRSMAEFVAKAMGVPVVIQPEARRLRDGRSEGKSDGKSDRQVDRKCDCSGPP